MMKNLAPGLVIALFASSIALADNAAPITLERLTQNLPWKSWGRPAEIQPLRELSVPGAAVFVAGEALILGLDALPAGNRLVLPRLDNVVQRAWWESVGGHVASDSTPLDEHEYRRPFIPETNRLLKFSQSLTEWTIALDGVQAPCVVVLDVSGSPRYAAEQFVIEPGADGVLTLPAYRSRTHGEKLQFEPLSHKNTVGYWVNPKDWAEWKIRTPTAQDWEVAIFQGCGGHAGSKVRLQMGEAKVEFEVEETGHFQNFRWRKVGRVTLPAGAHTVELRCDQLAKGAVMDMRQIRLQPVAVTRTSPRHLRESEPDVLVPPLTKESAGPGRRILLTAPGYENTNAYHQLTFPTNWNPQQKFPLIVELTGNGPYENQHGDRCTGRVEDASLGWGISGSSGAVWLSAPYLNAAGTANVRQWWGSSAEKKSTPTADYLRAAVKQACEQFGGHPDQIVLVGFSRGAIACNAIGLGDDETAKLWRAFVCFSHYDGLRTWPFAGSDAQAAGDRLRRLGNRPQFLCCENGCDPSASVTSLTNYLTQAKLRDHCVITETGFVNHDDRWTLRPSPVRDQLREWLRQSVPLSQ